MVMRLSNIEILDGWLAYIQQPDMLGSIVGRSKQNIMTAVDRLSLMGSEELYRLECPLKGEAGMDFALQYDTKSFFEGGIFKGRSERFNHFFELYARLVGPQKKFSLELDTLAGTGTQVAVFLDIQDRTDKVIEKLLSYQGENRRMPAMQRLLQNVAGLKPKTLGFIYSRPGMPMRFTFAGDYDSLLDVVQKLDAGRQSRAMQKALEHSEQLRELQANSPIVQDLRVLKGLGIFNCALDVDVMPDGSVGPIYGLELTPKASTVEEQTKLLSSQEFGSFVGLLEKGGVSDKRLYCIDKGIFEIPLPQEGCSPESLYSRLASFKIRYKQGKRLPAKIFIQGYRG